MELKSVFEIVKADRYSQEGCGKIAAETEDKIYKTGEISTATGLQKQPDGSWAPPKNGAGKPMIRHPDTLGMTKTGAAKRMEKAGLKQVGTKENKVYYEDPEGALMSLTINNGKVAQVETNYPSSEADRAQLAETKKELVEHLVKNGTPKANAEKFVQASSKGMLETMYNNMKNPGAAGSDKPKDGPYLDEQGLHDIYMDIKNNELEHFSTEQIAKEYKITKGDAEVIKNRIENNKRAKEQDKQDRRDQAAAQTNSPAKQKHYSFVKAGHHYRVPASSPAEAVQLLKSRGVKGFEESDAFDEDTPRTPAPEDAAPDRTYTQQSINGWREMTGDTKIRIKK